MLRGDGGTLGTGVETGNTPSGVCGVATWVRAVRPRWPCSRVARTIRPEERTSHEIHHFGSFRVRDKIFITVPPDNTHIHVFVSEQDRERALAAYPDFTEKLLWGGKVVGIRVTLATAPAAVVKGLVRLAYEHKATPVATRSSKKR